MSVLYDVVTRVAHSFVYYFILCLQNDGEWGVTKLQVKGKYTQTLVDLLHMPFVSSF